ncbi:hypothetical protein J7382_05425 [Shimia sp. R11_0]|uniref:Uncharacterized protein n=1 Tax=Shimia marina TaxID=321267 RepID=A0A0P1ESX5_9RHOB|nr:MULTISPECIES: hypothetical protein [Shimia]MBO9476969.1 hypothetical protein [Shimia sp. R11_0]CUH53635.1 hypothetical protein SHM7688_03091 [Shimia marina]SFD72350.1 hypothetical protein SAMN04488037_102179 [Shimia marina]
MLEKLRFTLPTIIASSLLFGFFFSVGRKMAQGETMKGKRGIMNYIAEALNYASDSFGAAQAGYAIMALSLFAGVFAAVWIWRNPML